MLKKYLDENHQQIGEAVVSWMSRIFETLFIHTRKKANDLQLFKILMIPMDILDEQVECFAQAEGT